MNLEILYPGRLSEDRKLLIYTGAPLPADTEISGPPLVVLEVSSTATDGAFFAYLEDVAPDGRVTYLDEGELRAANRSGTHGGTYASRCKAKASSSSRHDAQPLSPGEPAELEFCMWPTSVLLRKGHQIRVAIAGADANTFQRYPPAGDVTWTVYRQKALASYVDLPIATALVLQREPLFLSMFLLKYRSRQFCGTGHSAATFFDAQHTSLCYISR